MEQPGAMNQPVQPPTKPTPPSKPMEVPEKPSLIKKYWFLPIAVIVLLVLLMAGYLFTYQNFNIFNLSLLRKTSQETPTPVSSPTPATTSLEEQGTSDEISEIEADLRKTDLSDLDKELTDIEEELTSP